MFVTSAEANKKLKKLDTELKELEQKEAKSSVFNAASGEDEDKIRPEYDFKTVQARIMSIQGKIIQLKEKISRFNLETNLDDYGFDLSIMEALVYLPLLSKRVMTLQKMASLLPRERATSYGYGTNNVIDYRIANYDISEVQTEYSKEADRLSKLQIAIDTVNNTVKGIEMPD